MLRRLGYTGPLSRTLSLRVKTRARVTTCYLSLSLSLSLPFSLPWYCQLSVNIQYQMSRLSRAQRATQQSKKM